MPPRNHKDWTKEPKVEYINSLIYSDHSLYEQELENIFSKVWVPICHKSELEKAGSFKTTSIAGKLVIAINKGDYIQGYINTDKYTTPSGSMSRVDF
jgi:methanesulfonate monooxygenase large subunit